MARQITVTQEGFQKLQDELLERKTTKRDEIKEAIKVARDFGDLSENSEYDEAKEAEAQNQRRIEELEEMLKLVVVVDDNGSASDKVTAGKSVKVLNTSNGKEIVYTVVGPTEADPFARKISDQSPIGIALIGKKVGDKATAETPKGSVVFEILELL